MDYHNQVAIITGGASGIGRAISLELARLGCTVIINYNTSATAALELVKTIEANGGQARAYQCDVGSFAASKEFVDSVVQEFQRIDILVNNAGVTSDGLMLRMSESQFDSVIQTNLKGVWNMCKHVLRPMIKASFGRIINIASVSGVIGLAGQTNYSAAKAGILGLTKALAKEVGNRNITVNSIAPGFIETPMTGKLPPELVEASIKQIPVGRMGQPSDVAYAVAFLASSGASYIHGHTLEVDGGMTMV